MIEQLQSLMKALEAGSYNAKLPQLTDIDGHSVFCGDSGSRLLVNIEPPQDSKEVATKGYIDSQRACECPEVDERGIGRHSCHVKKERELHDPYRYFLGDHVWVHHK